MIRVSGPGSVKVAQACFYPWAKRQPPAREAVYGTWHWPSGKTDTTFATGAIDQVVVVYFSSPASYTGEDTVEISCHGSTYVQQAVLESCMEAGCRLAKPGEYTQRAFLNGRLDLAQAEGVADLIAAESAAAHKVALAQMSGNLSEEMRELRSALIEFAALIELENDFGEEDVEFADRLDLGQRVVKTQTHIDRLLSTFSAGQAMRNGVRVVIAGRPNAGKSTLLNALLGTDRAIVNEVAGTTRDTIEAEMDIEGVRFRLVDTAGIRDAVDVVEQEGVSRTHRAVAAAQVLIYVWDVVLTTPDDVASDLAKLARPGLPIVAVANKMDLNPYAKRAHYRDAKIEDEFFIPMVARDSMNLTLLRERLYDAGVGDVPAGGSTILTHVRHVTALTEAKDALTRVEQGLAGGLTGDLIALDLRQALHHIGSVTGEISVDDLLESIFSTFCIGK